MYIYIYIYIYIRIYYYCCIYVLHNLHGHSQRIQFFIFNLKESRLSDFFNFTGNKSHIFGPKTITIQSRDIHSALDVIQKYRFYEDHMNLFGTQIFILEYMVLKIQFCSVNYTLVSRICKNFEQNKPCWQWCSTRKQQIRGFKGNKTF